MKTFSFASWQLTLLVAVLLVSCAHGCQKLNRRNTIWLGLPGPDGDSMYVNWLSTPRLDPPSTFQHFSLLVSYPWKYIFSDFYRTSITTRVYRTDKFNYNVDMVDARADLVAKTLKKLSKTPKQRTTTAFEDLSIYSISNSTTNSKDPDAAFQVLKRLRKGVFQIVFRALYRDFPLKVSLSSKTYWLSESLESFYYLDQTGSVLIANVTGDNRDFNSTTSEYTIVDISEYLRENATFGPKGVSIVDSGGIVLVNYGRDAPNELCDQGSTAFLYNQSNLTFIGEQEINSAYWWDVPKTWWTYANDRQVLVLDYADNNTVVYNVTFTEEQLEKVVSRVSFGAWFGPLMALVILWVAVTVFCLGCCREHC